MSDTPTKKPDRGYTLIAVGIVCFGALAMTSATVWLIQNIRAMVGW